MRILFDQGVYDLRNKGNVALTQMAVRRIREMWPRASLEIMTSAPQISRLYFPKARAVNPYGQPYSDSLFRHIPLPLLRLLLETREAAWRRSPTRGRHPKSFLQSRRNEDDRVSSNRSIEPNASRNALEQVKGRDLFIATGAQYMSDACRDDALRVLERLEAAHELGIPTAMVGQGLGPFDDAELRARVRAVLPRVDLIFIRDRLSAPPLLESFGVDPARVMFTGDDAIELAYEARVAKLGNAMGVSLRFAPYTEVNAKHVEVMRAVLREALTQHNTTLLAIPISHSIHEQDDRMIRQVLNGQRNVSESGWRFGTPLEIIKTVGRCRIMVTGTFHAAVFALAQGIPAIGLAKSKMYLGKFSSLADQFGPGCQMVCLDDPNLHEDLARAIESAWERAEEWRPELLTSAARQIELARAAYRRLYQVVESRRREAGIEMGVNEYA